MASVYWSISTLVVSRTGQLCEWVDHKTMTVAFGFLSPFAYPGRAFECAETHLNPLQKSKQTPNKHLRNYPVPLLGAQVCVIPTSWMHPTGMVAGRHRHKDAREDES